MQILKRSIIIQNHESKMVTFIVLIQCLNLSTYRYVDIGPTVRDATASVL